MGGRLEIRSIGEVRQEHLPWAAQVAWDEGFDLMFEFEEKPDMVEIGKRVEAGNAISSMVSVVRLWVLASEVSSGREIKH